MLFCLVSTLFLTGLWILKSENAFVFVGEDPFICEEQD